MKIFGKKISWDLFSVVVNGKPKTIKAKTKEESEEILTMIQNAAKGDEAAIAQVQERVAVKPIEKRLEQFEETKEMTEEIKQTTQVLNETQEKRNKTIEQEKVSLDLKGSEDFVIEEENGEKKYFLKGFKSELPISFVEKVASLISKGVSYGHLIKFWMLNLLNPNAEARRGLYKYLTKQKMIITPEGYFVTFRRLVLVKKGTVASTVKKNADLDANIINEFATKVKKQKKGLRSFEVYESDGQLLLKPIKDHVENGKKFKFKGTLHDIVEGLKVESKNEEGKSVLTEDIYTDKHTHTMVIKIGETVWMDRDKCDSNAKVECSYGLHVGTPSFVGNGTSFGEVIVAVLVNPMHVISVPYADAHKMRVSEYFPFMVITPEQLKNFDTEDISMYELRYKEIENEKLEQSKNVVDNLTPEERKTFRVEKEITSQADVDALIKELEEKKKNLNNFVETKRTLLSDDVSKELDQDEIKRILQSRLG